jgi:hypothetical protein
MFMNAFAQCEAAPAAAFADQLQVIFDDYPELTITGSIGRAAIYDNFDAAVAPLDFQKYDWDGEVMLRDIDFIAPVGRPKDQGFYDLGPHHMDYNLYHLFEGAGTAAIVTQPALDQHINGVHIHEKLDPAVVAPRERRVIIPGQGERRVRTLAVGTQLYLGKAAHQGLEMRDTAKKSQYDAQLATFEAFAKDLQESGTAPDEFLPEAAYEPLLRFGRRWARAQAV